MAPTITIAANTHQWKAQGPKRATEAEALADLDFFPKSAKFVATGTYGGPGTTRYFQIEATGWLKPNRVTGAKNETAIKQYRTVVRNAESMGIEWDGTSCMAKFGTQGDFEAWLAR